MANTLTDLIPHIYGAVNMVARERVGHIPAANRYGNYDRCAIGQTLIIPTDNTQGASDIVPSMSMPNPADQTAENVQLTITRQRKTEFQYTGEETYALNAGPGYMSVQGLQIAGGLRTLCNEIETDLAEAAAKGASRAYGTAGTTPFSTDSSSLVDSAQMVKMLADNGAPKMGANMIVTTSASANIMSRGNLNYVNQAGSDTMLRQGVLMDLHGAMYRDTGSPYSHTKGAGTGYLTTAILAIGTTSITVDTGTGTVLAGDVVTFAGHTDKYVVGAALAGGVVTLNKPGLRVAVGNNVAMTIGENYTASTYCTGNAMQLASRLPEKPDGGDNRIEDMRVTDERSGIVFEFIKWPGYHKNAFTINAVWGVANIKPEFTGLLLG